MQFQYQKKSSSENYIKGMNYNNPIGIIGCRIGKLLAKYIEAFNGKLFFMILIRN